LSTQGIRQVKTTDLNPVYLFVAPPSMSALRARLCGRGSEGESAIQKRLAICLKEIEYAMEPNVHDIVIINDDFTKAYESFKKVALGERIAGDILPLLDD
jgi:guanylate kinase